MHRGEVGKSILQLEMDLRHVMEPNTALNLRVRKNNVLKDFVNIAGPLGITHFIIFSQTKIGSYVRITRLPRGPTLHFKIHKFSLAKDVVSILKRPKTYGTQYKHSPLMVLNNFDQSALPGKLMTSMFQNLFPSINIEKIKLAEIRRCVLINYDKENGMIDFRHYQIDISPIGMSKGVRKLLQSKVPNMGKLSDVSEYIERAAGGYGSESEAEDPIDNHVTLPQDLPGRGNIKSEKSSVKLTELGPQMSLQLMKIEDGLCTGEVLFHEFVQKTKEEVESLKKQRVAKRKLKEQRRKEQEENVKRKQKEKELNKKRSIAGQMKKIKMEKENKEHDGEVKQDEDNEDDEKSDISVESCNEEIKWYMEEVGEEPDEDLFSGKAHAIKSNKRKHKVRTKPDVISKKRVKLDTMSKTRKPLDRRKKKKNQRT
ncbi:suppressor of SWI4 1 homolog [Xenia sp. Carnegie-2017]|uniref:suppressor of SWI4 1 homolog n=1 Tax=Xenia sp. Carnegie-2017 TaxID=2897299 RepID=UPI001F035AB1|nr:suppressor of SWI4 1 homolog [Xenia sp. Carnegie-2017]XP_046844253.1 suppressor of SWI4 1 homolog [Xenia sp. Carnegie-2017]